MTHRTLAAGLFAAALVFLGRGGPAAADDKKDDVHHGHVVKVADGKLTMVGDDKKEVTHEVAKDAKITLDGKDAKLGDIAKGALVTFTLIPGKDGQPRTANEVVVSGSTFGGSVKRIDGEGVTVGNEKFDRVLKLAPTGKVIVDGKDAKVADLKVGDRVMVTLTADDSAAVLIEVGGKKRDGDKPKPEKGDGDKPKPEKVKPNGEE